MILTGDKIKKEVKRQKIKIEPFDKERITTNSYDLRLGDEVIQYKSEVMDPKVKPEFDQITIPEGGMLMQKGDFLLGSTLEKVGSDHYVPIIYGRSDVTREGLFTHITANLIDIGSFGNITLQLFATLPFKLYSGMLIAQVAFWVPKGEINLYDGKYQHSNGPRASLTYKDFK